LLNQEWGNRKCLADSTTTPQIDALMAAGKENEHSQAVSAALAVEVV